MSRPCRHHVGQRGAILIVAMVVLFAVAAMAIAMAHGARVDGLASANTLAALEAEAIARGAEAWVIQIATDESAAVFERPEEDFAARPLGEGWFWVVRPRTIDAVVEGGQGAFGLVDESTKIDLNAASRERLLEAPGMTEEMAASIIDWRDENEEEEPNGAESTYYGTLDPPYVAKNDRFESVEELMLVRGVTAEWLTGTGRSGDDTGAWADDDVVDGAFDRFTAYAGGGSDAVNLSADIVALSDDGRAFRRVRLVVRVVGDQPRVLQRVDVSERGWPLDPRVVASVRRGEGLPPHAASTSALTGGVR